MSTNGVESFLTIKEFASLVGFSPYTVKTFIDRGLVRSVKIGRTTHIPASDVGELTSRLVEQAEANRVAAASKA